MTHHLVLGGARSGKSRIAEAITLAQSDNAVYIATAQGGDQEMIDRINHHRQNRDPSWQLIEEPLNLAAVIDSQAEQKAESSILIDCLTLWLSNCLQTENWPTARDDFLASLARSKHPITMVSNEVGNGIVPLGELSRHFVDEAGRLHQELASICSNVTLVVAGIPTQIK